MTDHRRKLEPLHYGPRKREFALMAATLILALWWSVGGDVPEDRVLEPLAEHKLMCVRTRDGLQLRLAIEHRADQGIAYHECHYGYVSRWSAL
jgi:hypothetical protein